MSKGHAGYCVLRIAYCVLLVVWPAVVGSALAWDVGPGAIRLARKLLSSPRQDVWEQVQASKVIRFGVDLNDWPFAAVDAQGRLIGLHIDLGHALANRLGVEAHFVHVGYDGAYDALLTQQCDVLMGAPENDPARLAEFIYTGSYFDAGQVIITCNASARGVTHANDLRGKRIAVELGSEADAAARRLARRTAGVTLVECNSPEEALERMANGQADVAIADAVWARRAAAQRPEFYILPGSVEPYPLALATRADSPCLQTALGRALAQLQAEGKLDEIVARWLARPDPQGFPKPLGSIHTTAYTVRCPPVVGLTRGAADAPP